MKIKLENGTLTEATQLRHLRTLTGERNWDVDLYRLTDGREVVASCDAGDGRSVPREETGTDESDWT